MSDQKKIGCSGVPVPKKRKRDYTFTNAEKVHLISLIEKHFSIIENKKTDAVANRAKANEWMLVATEFNSSTGYIPRDMSSLKTQWDNLKKKAKQTMTIFRSNRYATGGGPSMETKEDPIIEKVISLIKTNAEGFSNMYDSDTILSGINEDCADEQVPSPPIVDCNNYSNNESAAEVLINGDWTNYTPAHLRTPRAKVLVENTDYKIVEEFETVVEVPETIVHEEIGLDKNTGSTPSVMLKSGMANKTVKLENKIPLMSATKSTRHLLANRRRPVLKESEAVALATKKMETLNTTVEQSKEEHEVVMRCLFLQEEQEKEKLKQEKEKTEQEIIRKKILEAELEKISNQFHHNEF